MTRRLAHLHIEAVGGVAGDMLLAALLDAGAASQVIEDVFASTKVADLSLRYERVQVLGDSAVSVRSIAPSHEGGPHPHNHLNDIFALIDSAAMSSESRARAKTIFQILATAEARVHGGTATSVHLHEVGEVDSVFDVVGIVVALETLGYPTLTAGPLPSGHGRVHSSHGWLDCPVPAVVKVAEAHGVPLVDVDIDSETITPTGIASLAGLGVQWLQAIPAGYRCLGIGAGTRRFDSRPNVVRVYGDDVHNES